MRPILTAPRFSVIQVGLGAVLASVVMMLALLASSTWLSTPACTGQQVRDGTVIVEEAAPLIPSPAGAIVHIAAGQLDRAVTEYLTLHPEKLNQKLGWADWGEIATLLGGGLFGLHKYRNRTRTNALTDQANATAGAIASSGSAAVVRAILSEALPGKAMVEPGKVAEIVADAKVTTAETKAETKAADEKL